MGEGEPRGGHHVEKFLFFPNMTPDLLKVGRRPTLGHRWTDYPDIPGQAIALMPAC